MFLSLLGWKPSKINKVKNFHMETFFCNGFISQIFLKFWPNSVILLQVFGKLAQNKSITSRWKQTAFYLPTFSRAINCCKTSFLLSGKKGTKRADFTSSRKRRSASLYQVFFIVPYFARIYDRPINRFSAALIKPPILIELACKVTRAVNFWDPGIFSVGHARANMSDWPKWVTGDYF